MPKNAEGTAPKAKKQVRNAVSVAQTVTTAIQIGKDNYLMKGTSDGRGIRLENGEGGIFIPYGVGGKAIVENLTKQVDAGSATRGRRRTKAEMAAQTAQNS